MANRSGFRKLQSPNTGGVLVAFDFIVADNDSDGYMTQFPTDAYGGGVKGVIKVDTGVYEAILNEEYHRLLAYGGSVASSSIKDFTINWQCNSVGASPMVSITGTDGKKRSKIVFRVLTATTPTDPGVGDRISLWFILDNSSA